MEFSQNQSGLSKIKKVSLVDDDLVSNLLTSKTIKKSGFASSVSAFDNAKDALSDIMRLVQTDPEQLPELIFLDIGMPAMDGLEFLEEFDKLPMPLPEKCKVYMLSSSINAKEIQEARNHNKVYDFISKPLTVNKLERIYSQWGFA